jgi:hypothetical protein
MPSYDGCMKLFWLAALTGVVALGASSPQLQQVQSVYILPMGSGMDQFLANRLARFGKMQVVADPLHADAILTDRLGEPFEKKLDELYPAPVEKDAGEEDATGTLKEDPARIRAFSRGRGTFFLVDRKTRNVLWSTYERPKNGSPDELNRIAERVVNTLKHDLKPSQAGQ